MNEILGKLRASVIAGDEDEAKKYAQEALQTGIPPAEALKALISGIEEVGECWKKEGMFLTEVTLASFAMKAGSEVLEEELRKRGESAETNGTIVLGTVKGDIHDLGKKIVGVLLEAARFKVHDLGVDVDANQFVSKVKELKPDILGLSALMTVTLPEQRVIIEKLKAENLRGNVKVVVGGAPVTEEWSSEIGADGFSSDGLSGVETVKALLARK